MAKDLIFCLMLMISVSNSAFPFRTAATSGLFTLNGFYNGTNSTNVVLPPMEGYAIDMTISTPEKKAIDLLVGTMVVPELPTQNTQDNWNCWWLGAGDSTGGPCGVLMQPVLRYVPTGAGGKGQYQMNIWFLGQQNGKPTVNASKTETTDFVNMNPGDVIISGIQLLREDKTRQQQFFRQWWQSQSSGEKQELVSYVYTGNIDGKQCDTTASWVFGYVMEPNKITTKTQLPGNLNGLKMNQVTVKANGQTLNTNDNIWKKYQSDAAKQYNADIHSEQQGKTIEMTMS